MERAAAVDGGRQQEVGSRRPAADGQSRAVAPAVAMAASAERRKCGERASGPAFFGFDALGDGPLQHALAGRRPASLRRQPPWHLAHGIGP